MTQASRPGRGGRPAQISVDRITRAAIDLLDREGADALTMRRLGTHLGVAAMSLYRHLPSRDAVISKVVDHLFTTALTGLDTAGAWPRALTDFATAYRRMLLDHPHAVPLLATHPVDPDTARPLLAPLLRCFTTAGIDTDDALIRIQSVGVYTLGHALAQVGRPPGTGASEDEPAAAPEADEYYRRWFETGLHAMISGFDTGRPLP
ncbi:TetR/AcrR family transcriptional regulator C-terminal domain-containing protein [Streptomyces sp. NPDC093801]|uniref:TetR/AcrR family transcriptional regulator n=1 Tax=Streptomyces sp. NPDC093801 TaxID=3155203 RepID=UPI00344EAA4C